MTDQELLELAAKAVGASLTPLNCIWNDKIAEFVEWNPLVNDGDAFRLAAKLHMCVSITPSGTNVTKHNKDYYEVTSGSEQAHGDPYEATRRAIVRAAAAIGKTID